MNEEDEMSKKEYTLKNPTYYLNGEESGASTILVGVWEYKDTNKDKEYDSYDYIGIVCYSFTTGSKFLSNPEIKLGNIRCNANANVVWKETAQTSDGGPGSEIKHLAFKITNSVKDDYKDMFGNNSAAHPIGRAEECTVTDLGGGAADFSSMIGNADSVVLLPNTEYYLWIYPNSMGRVLSTSDAYNSAPTYGRRFQFANKETITLTMDETESGVFNLVKDDKTVSAIPYVVKNKRLNRAIPYIVKDRNLHICS